MLMNSKDFIDILKIAKSVPNYYCNKFPKNLGYFDGARYSFDCWNLIKVCLSGWLPGGGIGSYLSPSKLVTGDCDGATLLKSCTNRSKDFSKISVPGTYLYMSSSPHSGIYIGEFQEGDKIYNVIECTKNLYSGQNGVTYSYVDQDGKRSAWKGASGKTKWSEYGLLTKYLNYDNDINEVKPVEEPAKPVSDNNEYDTYVVKAGDSLSSISAKYGLTLDDILKANPQIANPDLIYPKQVILIPKKETKKPNAKQEEVWYTVKPGDRLSIICGKNHVSMSSVLALNPGITNPDLIYPNQKIRLK